MRKYRINRSNTGGGIKIDGSPEVIETIRGVLIHHTPPTQCNPYDTQYGDDIWVAISFIDLTLGKPDWAFTIMNKGKSNALQNFDRYVNGSDPFNNIFNLSLRETSNMDSSKRWYTYSFTQEPLSLRISDLLAEVLKVNNSLPLIEPQIAAHFPEPPRLTEIINSIKEIELEKLKLIEQIQVSEEVAAHLEDNIDPEVWGGLSW
jgi:hypothetical protein